MAFFNYQHKLKQACVSACVLSSLMAYSSLAQAGSGISLAVSRSSLIAVKTPVKEIVIANPDIADVYANSSKSLTVIGKAAGSTTVRLFDESGKLLQTLEVSVGYDLPAMRKALKTLLPEENIAVEMINSSVALTGNVRSNASVDKALKIVQEYVANAAGGQKETVSSADSQPSSTGASGNPYPKILNMMKLISGQQVMLRVRVAEVNRDALKNLGIDINAITPASLAGGSSSMFFGTGGGLNSIFVAPGATAPARGSFTESIDSTDVKGIFGGRYQPNGVNGKSIGGVIKALEQDGLIKTLAEPNLVAVSGETADFLAGGEIPVLIPSTGTGATTATVEYKPIGVSVKFTPDVLSENRIRMLVQPEVSEVSDANSIQMSGFIIPSITTRRAKTTVELAPGESFMIAGLLKDTTKASIDQLPGLKDLPVLGAMFRDTAFQRHETELVITVTPYLVDPMKSSDVKLPTDDFRPASQMEMFFYGALGALGSDGRSVTQTPRLEGPTGFMVD